MVRRDFKDMDDEAPGFSRYWQDSRSNGILLPIAVAAAIEVAAEAAAAEKKACTAKVIPIPPVLGANPCQKSESAPTTT